MMITGDYHYTATSVARQVGMISPDGKVMLIQAESEFRSLRPDPSLSESQHEAQPGSPGSAATELGRLSGSQQHHSVQAASETDSAHGPSVSVFESSSPKQMASFHGGQLSRAKSALKRHGTAQSRRLLVSYALPPERQDLSSMTHQYNGGVRTPQGHIGEPQGFVNYPQRLTHQECAYSQGHGQEAEQPLEHALVGQQELLEQAPGRLARLWGRFYNPSGLLQRTAQQSGSHSSRGNLLNNHDHQQSTESLQWHPQPASGHPQEPLGHPQEPQGHPQELCQGLRVTLEGKEEVFQGESALQALTSVAQGQAQCCVTGPAFTQLLQQADSSVLEIVMQNVVVFARMQSHQKGQVMELLGARGLYQMLGNQQRHIQVNHHQALDRCPNCTEHVHAGYLKICHCTCVQVYTNHMHADALTKFSATSHAQGLTVLQADRVAPSFLQQIVLSIAQVMYVLASCQRSCSSWLCNTY